MSSVLSDPAGRGLTPEHRAPSSYRQLPEFGGVDRILLLVGGELEKRWSDDSTALGAICHYALVPTGKLFRPVLLLEAALAVGGELQRVLPAAVGAECGHVASLIHDDIIDNDDLRRGRESVQHKYGIGDAIVAGDALIFDLFASLAECRTTGVPDSRVVSALASVASAGLDLCRGQSLESELSRDLRFDVDAYLTVARLKTAAYFRGTCESGALLAGGTPESVAGLAAYGDNLGIAFQIADDLLAYVSDSTNTGKPGTSDLENRRMTLPIILAYQSATPAEQDAIRAAMTSNGDPTLALAVLQDVLARTGAIAEAGAMARDYAERARSALDVLPQSPSRDRLSFIAELVIARDH